MTVITQYKTSELIRMTHNNGKYIVCHNHKEAYRIAEVARESKFNIQFPLTYQEFVNRRYSGGIPALLIDNVDALIQYMAKVKVEAITIDKELI